MQVHAVYDYACKTMSAYIYIYTCECSKLSQNFNPFLLSMELSRSLLSQFPWPRFCAQTSVVCTIRIARNKSGCGCAGRAWANSVELFLPLTTIDSSAPPVCTRATPRQPLIGILQQRNGVVPLDNFWWVWLTATEKLGIVDGSCSRFGRVCLQHMFIYMFPFECPDSLGLKDEILWNFVCYLMEFEAVGHGEAGGSMLRMLRRSPKCMGWDWDLD